MTTAILIWWWIFLVAAVLVTLVDVLLLLRVVHLSRQIFTLASKTSTAALGIAAHTAAGTELNRLIELVNSLAQTSDGLVEPSSSLREQLTPKGR